MMKSSIHIAFHTQTLRHLVACSAMTWFLSALPSCAASASDSDADATSEPTNVTASPSGPGSVVVSPTSATGDIDESENPATSAIALQALPQPPRPWRKFGETLGVNTKFAQGESQADLALVTELGARWVRDTVAWNTLEPSAGKFVDFPAAFYERLNYYKAHDIGVVFLLAYDAYTAYTPTSDNPTAAFATVPFGKYAVEAARLLRNAGVRFVLELWNEPHNMVLRPTLGGNWNGAAPSPWVDYYVRMVQEAVRQVNAFDSSIRLLTDDDMWVLHYHFLDAGLPPTLNGFAFHPYVQGVPERAAIDQNTNWMSPYVGVDPDSSFVSAVRRLRDYGQQKLGHTPEMWATEWGWPTNEQFNEDTVASFLPRAFILAEAAGTEALCWFSIQDCVDGPMGLTANDGTKRKAYRAMKALNENLADYYFVQQLSGSDHQTTGMQAYLFKRDTRAKLAVWSVEPSVVWLKLTGQLRGAKLVDEFGQTLTPVRGQSGSNWVRVGAAPVYVDFALRTTAPLLTTAECTSTTPP
jgi:hypothetical protein